MSPMSLGIVASSHVNAATYQAAVLADSPTWYFPLDAGPTPIDAMGYATATTSPTVVYGAAHNLGDGATSYDFQGGYVNVGKNPYGFGSFTVECLIKPDTLTNPMNVVTQFRGAGTTNSVFILAVVSGKLYFHLFNTAGGNVGGSPYAGTTTLVAGTSYHLAAKFTFISNSGGVISFGELKGYVNGVPEVNVTSGASAGTWGTGGNVTNHIIGSDHTAGFPFDGKLAGAAFYQTALSDARIAAHSAASGH